MYALGMTQAEIAKDIGSTQKAVFTAMRRFDLPRRPQSPRDQRGPKNNAWKGTDAKYQAKHARLYRSQGQPKKCEVCATTTAKSYDWANLTGDYDNPKDYRRMCRSCHRRYDNARRRAAP